MTLTRDPRYAPDWSNGKEMWANDSPMDAEAMLVQQAAMIKAQACPTTCPLPHGCKKRSDCHKKVWVYRNGIKALPWCVRACQLATRRLNQHDFSE